MFSKKGPAHIINIYRIHKTVVIGRKEYTMQTLQNSANNEIPVVL